ncbi:MAG TPA: methyltransferase domain-containing protein [Chloroflexota bacterium]|nr:methyltransferase domain-containing protein [Chloroflexota bacterium]
MPSVALDLGCGRRAKPGAIGVDGVALPGVHVVARLGEGHLPFRSGAAHTIYALNVLEHLDDLPAVMAEIWRALASGGRLVVEVPYFSSVSAFADPTHRRWFTYTTFEHFAPPLQQGWAANRHNWFGDVRFQIVRRRLRFGKAHRLFGAAWLANRWPALYENFLAYWFPARALEVELRRSAAA